MTERRFSFFGAALACRKHTDYRLHDRKDIFLFKWHIWITPRLIFKLFWYNPRLQKLILTLLAQPPSAETYHYPSGTAPVCRNVSLPSGTAPVCRNLFVPFWHSPRLQKLIITLLTQPMSAETVVFWVFIRAYSACVRILQSLSAFHAWESSLSNPR